MEHFGQLSHFFLRVLAGFSLIVLVYAQPNTFGPMSSLFQEMLGPMLNVPINPVLPVALLLPTFGICIAMGICTRIVSAASLWVILGALVLTLVHTNGCCKSVNPQSALLLLPLLVGLSLLTALDGGKRTVVPRLWRFKLL